MRVALDTKVLVYAEGHGDALRCRQAIDLIERLDKVDVLVPAQVLGELFRVLTGKAGRTATSARDAVLSWADSFATAESSWPAFQAAFDLVADHALSFWDALILSVVAEQHCRLLLSEDFRAGFTWRGVTVVNPFAAEPTPLLTTLLGESHPAPTQPD